MATPFPNFTKKWHNDTYPAISPTLPSLSTKGKSVLITGGGSGIGESITRAFAASGSIELAILGRRENVLKETARSVELAYPGTTVKTFVADVSKADTVQAVFDGILKVFGRIDICISNAGYLSGVDSVTASDLEDWWTTYETNVKGSFNIARAFLRDAKPGSTLLDVSTGMGHMPAVVPGHSAYVTSKLAAAKLHEYIAFEHPEIHVVTLQPGVIVSDMSQKSGFPGLDQPNLPAHVAVWLVSAEAKFLRGRFIWCNWDVEELVSRKKEIIEDPEMFTLGLMGLSFREWKLEQTFEYAKNL